jgi:trk system potassium uptake protein
MASSRGPEREPTEAAHPPTPERVTLEPYRPPQPPTRTSLLLAAGFLAMILVGSILLTLPAANRFDVATPPLTALFTATSAVCVTGLVVVDTRDYWSPFGQAVILVLMQLGGLGFLASSTILLMFVKRRLSLRERIWLKESQGVVPLGGVLSLVRQIAVVTLTLQFLGAVVLTLRFAGEFPLDWALWIGLFHAVSAFNNAGFDLMGGFQSLTAYREDPVVVMTVAILVLFGAFSFVVLAEVAAERNFRRLLLDTKLVLVTMAALLAVGTLSLLLIEYDNPNTLAPLGWPARVMNAFFMTTSRTSGFSTVSVGTMMEGSLLLLIVMMYIGGSAGSLAGGIKVNTFAALTAAVFAAMSGRTETTAFGRQIPNEQIYRALTIALLGLGVVVVLTLLLTFTEDFDFLRLMFEATSAFGIVGLSTGITSELTDTGKLLIIITMYAGRIGPLTLALALVQRERPSPYKFPEGRIRMG